MKIFNILFGVFGIRQSMRRNIRLYDSIDIIDEQPPLIQPKLTVKDEISDIINLYLYSPPSIPLETLNPKDLLEKSFLLSKSDIYEQIMEEKLMICESIEEVERLEKVDKFLRRFISSERKSRSRLKLNYLIAGAASSRFEEAVKMLSECDEIDSVLIQYTKNCIQKEYQRLLGPTALSIDDDTTTTTTNNNNNNNINKNIQENDERIPAESAGAKVINILKMILKRLEVELKMKNNKYIAILGQLLSDNDIQRREIILRTNLNRVEDIQEFKDFLADGINHIKTLEIQSQGSSSQSSSDNTNTNNNKNKQIYNDIRKSKNKFTTTIDSTTTTTTTTLSLGTLEKLIDIQYLLIHMEGSLVTGIKNNDIYSTSDEDYIQFSTGSTSSSSSSSSSSSNVDVENNDEMRRRLMTDSQDGSGKEEDDEEEEGGDAGFDVFDITQSYDS